MHRTASAKTAILTVATVTLLAAWGDGGQSGPAQAGADRDPATVEHGEQNGEATEARDRTIEDGAAPGRCRPGPPTRPC